MGKVRVNCVLEFDEDDIKHLFKGYYHVVKGKLSITSGTKKCSSCKAQKPLEHFSKNRITKDGLQRDCKLCNKSGRKKIVKEVLKEGKKWCSCCKKDKPKEEFPKLSSSKDGLGYRCNVCNRAGVKASQDKNKKLKEDSEPEEVVELGEAIDDIDIEEEELVQVQDKNKKKVCAGCKKEKLLEEFTPYRKSKDGRYGRCRQCERERNFNVDLNALHPWKNLDAKKIAQEGTKNHGGMMKFRLDSRAELLLPEGVDYEARIINYINRVINQDLDEDGKEGKKTRAPSLGRALRKRKRK